jgi:hypothetical protein
VGGGADARVVAGEGAQASIGGGCPAQCGRPGMEAAVGSDAESGRRWRRVWAGWSTISARQVMGSSERRWCVGQSRRQYFSKPILFRVCGERGK